MACVACVVSGCGKSSAWPRCLKIASVQRTRIARPQDLRKIPKAYAAERVAAIDFGNGTTALLVASRTAASAAVVQGVLQYTLQLAPLMFPPPPAHIHLNTPLEPA